MVQVLSNGIPYYYMFGNMESSLYSKQFIRFSVNMKLRLCDCFLEKEKEASSLRYEMVTLFLEQLK